MFIQQCYLEGVLQIPLLGLKKILNFQKQNWVPSSIMETVVFYIAIQHNRFLWEMEYLGNVTIMYTTIWLK